MPCTGDGDDGTVTIDTTSGVTAEQVASVAAQAGVLLVELRAADRTGLEQLFFALTSRRRHRHRSRGGLPMITATPTVASTSHLGPGIPFTRSLRVEWRKSIDTRAARWLLASVVAVSVIAAIVPIATPHSSAQDLSNYLAIVAIGVTLLLPVVSILTLTSEWSQRTVLTTFTQDPRRDRVLAAKLAVGLGLAAIGGLAGLVIASAGLQVSDALGRARLLEHRFLRAHRIRGCSSCSAA